MRINRNNAWVESVVIAAIIAFFPLAAAIFNAVVPEQPDACHAAGYLEKVYACVGRAPHAAYCLAADGTLVPFAQATAK